ncbi:MAG: ABC transporter ATP-binding protein [Chloroflexi bacterium]|nr:MAG: ABC transporter ATP-binding protein [Chloroflexota bacterium]
MGMWGGAGAGGWSNQGGHVRPGSQRRGADGWDDDELGKVYDHSVVRRLLPYLRPYRGRAFTAIFAMIVFAAVSRTQPFLIGLAIDRYIESENLRGVAFIGLALLGLALAGWLAQWVQQVMTAFMGHRILLTLRTQMFNHIQKLSLSFLDRNETGRVMSRVTSDVTVMQELLTTGFLTVFADFVGIGIVVGFLLYQDVQLTLITLSVVPLLVVILVAWQIRARIAFVRVRQAIAQVNANLQENVSGVRVIQSMSREDENAKRFDKVNAKNWSANVQAGRITAMIMPVVELLTALATALVIIFGGMRVLDGTLTVGILIAFTLYVQQFFDPIRDLVLQYTQLQRAMAGGQRIFEVLDTKPEIVDAADAVDLPDIRGEVVFDNVSFEYVEGQMVLEEINLTVQAGETIAIVGPTGAGKSTLTSLVPRFYDVTEGRVLIDGHDIRKIKRDSIARRLGIVLQDPFLFSGTVRQNIRYGRLEASQEEVEEAARTVGAHEFIERLPQGYDTVLHERGQNLSVGQRQLIAFARAVIADPRILILDEATANVDTRTEVVIQDALNRLLKDRTSFVIAHRLSTIRNATRIVALQDGRITEVGTHAELLARDGLYARLYRMTYEQAEPESDDGGQQPGAPAPQPAG